MHTYPWQLDPPSVEDRCLEYHFTTLGRSSQIYWQIYSPSNKHICIEYCYTKLGRSHGRSIYIYHNTHIPMAD